MCVGVFWFVLGGGMGYVLLCGSGWCVFVSCWVNGD